MPAKTAKQARFMRMVKARQHGHKVGGPKVRRAARTMRQSDVEEFTHTMAEFKGMKMERKK